MGVYCDKDDVRRAAGQSDAFGTDQEAAVGNWIERASAMIDQWTGQWFDDRTLLVRTRPVTEAQTSLFLPAPLIELRSVAIDGAALDMDQVVKVAGWLERSDGSPWTCDGRMGIVLTGVFGFDPIPGPIVEYTAALAATLGGFRVRGALAGDGTFQAIRDNTIPEWAKKLLDGFTRQKFVHQPFTLEDIPEE